MVVNVIFGCLILSQGVSVLGTLINPQNLPGKSNFHVHCLNSNKPIQIKDPFDPKLIEDKKFIAMEWYQIVFSSSGEEPTETLLIQFLPNKTNVFKDKFSVFDLWGLQIHSVGLEDSATYKSKLVHLSGGREWSVNLVVSTPPVLKSEKLSVSKVVNEEGQTVTLSCGQLSSLGSPPVPLVWKIENGTVLPTEYKDGYIKLTVPSDKDAGKYSCHVNMSSVAARCIPETDTARFMVVLASSAKLESADATGIIVGAVVGALVVFIIIAIVVFIKMRRQPKSETYNTREQEKKRDAEVGRTNGISLLKEEEDHHGKSRGPIYKGVVSADSFMISKMSEGSSDLVFKKVNPQIQSSKNMGYLNGDKSGLTDHRLQTPEKSSKVAKQEENRTKQKTESGKKKSEANGHQGKEATLLEVQQKSFLKHSNGVGVNGTIGNGNVANGTANNGIAGKGVVLGHATLV